MIPLDVALVGAFALFAVGLYSLATCKNMIIIVMGVEIMMNGAIMALVALAVGPTGLIDPLAQALAILAIAVGGATTAVGLAIITQVYKHYKTLNVRELKRLRH
jgi:NADH:ubiquinone oxidoreductase subunit K